MSLQPDQPAGRSRPTAAIPRTGPIQRPAPCCTSTPIFTDPAGNRTSEQIDGNVTGASYNNLNQLPVSVSLPFDPAKFGFQAGKQYRFTGATFTKTGDSYTVNVSIQSDSHTLIEISEA